MNIEYSSIQRDLQVVIVNDVSFDYNPIKGPTWLIEMSLLEPLIAGLQKKHRNSTK